MLTTTSVLWISCIFFTIIFTRTCTHTTQNLLPTFLLKIKTDHVNPHVPYKTLAAKWLSVLVWQKSSIMQNDFLTKQRKN